MNKSKSIGFIKIIIFLLVAGCLLMMGLAGYKYLNKDTNTDQESSVKGVKMIDLTEKTPTEIQFYADQYSLNLNINSAYNDSIAKDKVISQSITEGTIINAGDNLEVVISLGKIDKTVLKNDGINEMGQVPVMMYHGIVNTPSASTGNTGGNVDKEGYDRTTEAFINDLDTYYEQGYRLIRLKDYVDGNINIAYGYSPIVLTFDDGKENNIKVTGLDSNGDIIIDENSAVGVLEQFKKKHPDYNVTATFFVNEGLFNQPKYNEKIMHWLINNNYDIGNHTKTHVDFKNIDATKTQEEVGYMYNYLNSIIGNKYVNIVALPFGSPYVTTHSNYQYILNGTYNNEEYITSAALRVGWEGDLSPYDKDFDKTYIKRIRAYDNNGKEFDITMNLSLLKNKRYISDGNVNTIVTMETNKTKIIDTSKEVITY